MPEHCDTATLADTIALLEKRVAELEKRNQLLQRHWFHSLLKTLVIAPPILLPVLLLLERLSGVTNWPLGLFIMAGWAVAVVLWAITEVLTGNNFRFGLLRLLFVTAIFAVLFGSWKSYILDPGAREERTLAAIHGVKGTVWREPKGPNWLRSLIGDRHFNRVVQFHIAEGGSDEELRHLKEFPHLRCLFVTGPGFTDAGLEHLKDLHQPVQVWLTGTKVTKAALNDLNQVVPNLELRLQ